MKSALLLLTGLWFLPAKHARAQLTAKTADNAFLITRMAEIYHVQPRAVDREFSGDLFSQMITALDADKIYFTGEDLNQLKSWQYTLDQELLNRKAVFLDALISLFGKRIRQTDSLLDIFSKTSFPLNTGDSYTVAEDTVFAYNDGLRRIRLNKLFRRNVLETMADEYDENDSPRHELKADSLESAARKKVWHAFKRDIQRILQFNNGLPGFVCNAWCESVASCFDPHTEFFSMAKKEEFQAELGDKQLQFGFGLADGKEGTEISRLKPGSPAYKCGQIHEGDAVLALQWEGNEEVDVSDGSPAEVSALISGDHPKSLTLTLKKGDGSIRKVTLQREKAEVDDDNSKVRSFVIKGAHRIGFISLPAFYTDWESDASGSDKGCADDVAKEILKLKKDSIEGLILDLRYNGGGSMTEAIALAGIFIDVGPVGMTKNKEGKVFTMKDVNRGSVYDGPLLLLVNGFSASASEVLAGTLQDYHRALIVGSPTFGKATAQVVLPLDTVFDEDHLERMKSAENFIKVTVERLYRVNGSSAQETGVIPDILLRDFTATRSEREKTLPFALDNKTIDSNKNYHAYPALPVERLKTFASSFTDTCAYIKSFNQFLDGLMALQSPKDESLSLQKVRADHVKMKKFLEDRDRSQSSVSLPYEIQWNEFEKIRMQADEDLRNTNLQLTSVLSRDPGLLLGYQLATRMLPQ
ncbi:MAG: S41 family peptidase [Bacteroidota bacterium]|nr:S41 family peptidase [Bacteroidota bacterium]